MSVAQDGERLVVVIVSIIVVGVVIVSVIVVGVVIVSVIVVGIVVSIVIVGVVVIPVVVVGQTVRLLDFTDGERAVDIDDHMDFHLVANRDGLLDSRSLSNDGPWLDAFLRRGSVAIGTGGASVARYRTR